MFFARLVPFESTFTLGFASQYQIQDKPRKKHGFLKIQIFIFSEKISPKIFCQKLFFLIFFCFFMFFKVDLYGTP